MSSEFDKIFLFSSGSSDSESLLEEELSSSENEINKEWEAIERTLYQEPGEGVTNPELLKECKLWRDSFPHFRVKGTKIDVEKNGDEEEKSIQTLENHLNLKKIEEKRKTIKNKVVDQLVDRIITKFSLGNDGSSTPSGDVKRSSGVEITEIEDKKPKTPLKSETKSVVLKAEKESYFERGKSKDEKGVARVETVDNLQKLLDTLEKDLRPTEGRKTPDLPNELKKIYKKTSKMSPIGLKCLENIPSARLSKPRPSSDSLSNLVKPFEMTKKIDKKYEGILEKIMDKKYKEMIPIHHCRKINSGVDMRNHQGPLGKLRTASGFEGYLGKSKNLPKINKFNNNWLDRGEVNFAEEDYPLNKTKTGRRGPNAERDLNVFEQDWNQGDFDEKFMEELKKEMMLNYKRPPRRSGVIEEINLRRPKPLKFNERSLKSSSCGDLPKKGKKDIKPRNMRGGIYNGRNESTAKIRAKSTNFNDNNNNKGIKTIVLPPIESGIICTELTGRPKIGPRYPSKKKF